MSTRGEKKIFARGLKAPGALLLVKKSISGKSYGTLRIIVSYEEAVDELKKYFLERGVESEVDNAGDDYHLLIDLRNFKDVD